MIIKKILMTPRWEGSRRSSSQLAGRTWPRWTSRRRSSQSCRRWSPPVQPFSLPISIQTVAFRFALTHEWKEVSEVVFLLLQNNYYQVVSNVMVVGDGRKYLTCLITLKVVNMMMLVKNLLWTIVDVSLKIHHRWLRTQRLWLQQNSLTQEQLVGFRVLAVRSLLIKDIKDPLLKWQTVDPDNGNIVVICRIMPTALFGSKTGLSFFSSGNHLQGWTL